MLKAVPSAVALQRSKLSKMKMTVKMTPARLPSRQYTTIGMMGSHANDSDRMLDMYPWHKSHEFFFSF